MNICNAAFANATLQGTGPMPTTLAYPFAREAPSEYISLSRMEGLPIFTDTRIFFLGLGLDSGGNFGGVLHLRVRGGGGHRPPGFAARHADTNCDNGHNEKLFHKGEFWMPNSIRR